MKQPYLYLLFDADDTLLDFQESERTALNGLFKSLNIELTPYLKERYQSINHSLWASFERGEITRDEILNTRFRKLFQEEGIPVTHPALEKEYQERLASCHALIPGALSLLAALKPDYQLYIVSNGVASTQYNRLKASNLYSYFDGIFISEETGYQKPQIEFFDYVSKRIEGFDPCHALIIGDSLASDMQGGINAGIDTCWYNPNHKENLSNLPLTYMVSSFQELLALLKK